MTDIDVYVGAVLSEGVLGVGALSTASQVEQALGSGFLEHTDRRRQSKIWSYELVEFAFAKTGREWLCAHVAIQVHRLSIPDVDIDLIVPHSLRSRYGEFRRFVNADELLATIRDWSMHVVGSEEDIGSVFAGMRVVGTNSFVTIMGDRGRVRDGGPGFGDIWSISLRSRGTEFDAVLRQYQQDGPTPK